MTNRRSPVISIVLTAMMALVPIAGFGQDAPKPLLPPILGSQDDSATINPLGNRLTTQPPPLAAPSAGTLGTLPAGTLGVIPAGALPAVSPAANAELLARISAPLPVSALVTTARELLLDRAVVGASAATDRARALYNLGLIEDAAGAAVEGSVNSVADRVLAARTLLALGREGQACERADVDVLPKNAAPEPTFELLEVLVLCKLAQGADDAARLVIEVLRDQGGSDALFLASFQAAVGESASFPEPNTVKRLRPIHVAMMRRAGRELTPALVARSDLALTTVLAGDQGLGSDARIVATERAVQAGLMPVDVLVDLYISTPLEEDLLLQAVGGKAPVGPLARSHFFALVAEAPTDAERMEFIAEAYRQGVDAGVGAAIAEAFGEDLAGVIAVPELGSWAGMAIEILVRGDRPRVAVPWIDAGEAPGPDGKPTLDQMEAHVARALIAVAAPELGFGVAAGALGADAGGAQIGEDDRQFVAREAALLAALGDLVPLVLVEIVGNPASVAAPDNGPIAVLSALAPLAGSTLMDVSDEAVTGAVAALVSFGSSYEARRTAIEALIAKAPD